MIMNQGVIAFEGTPHELAGNEEVRRIFLGEDFRMLTP
jgi:ABC-type lipopolysaccharide export system ATPase subunit